MCIALAGLWPARVFASGCPNEAVRELEAMSTGLPDCRAYEQVTPVNKDATSINGGDSAVQVSAAGDRIAFPVIADMPGGEGSGNFPFFLASRGVEGWTSQGLTPRTPPGKEPEANVLGWSEDLSRVLVVDNLEGLEGGARLYLRDTTRDVLERIVAAGVGEAHSAGFSADGSRLFFESTAPLLPSATPEKTNLYEFDLDTRSLSLVGLLPASEGGTAPPGGSFAGPYDWVHNNSESGGATGYYTSEAISRDGTRAVFTAGVSGQLYARLHATTSVRVSASRRSVPDPNGAKPAAFMGATPDGAKVFFVSCEKLTNDSTAVSTAAASCGEAEQGQDLYEYDIAHETLNDLTVDSNTEDVLGAAVQGVLGHSADGSYVYFVANGVLPGSGATTPGTCHRVEPHGACNLYVSHNGSISYIATLNAEPTPQSTGLGDAEDWTANPFIRGEAREKTSRVSSDGTTLVFSSTQNLTGYDSGGLPEFYLFHAEPKGGSGRVVCVSCSPTGNPPAGRPLLESPNPISSAGGRAPSLTRNLSTDGRRFFFSTPDALLPQDTNNAEDVYEWEAPGAGTCSMTSAAFEPSSGGCLYLISTGRSPDPSYFADASENGDGAFVFTSQPLVQQDQDSLIDIYAARVDGGLTQQNTPPPVPCADESCRATPTPAPGLAALASLAFSGEGNPGPPSTTTASHPKPRSSTRAQKLARALRACRREPRRQRAACLRRAHRKYGTKPRTVRPGHGAKATSQRSGS
jgi:WD40-like Beta Propeller Repeat